MVNYISPRCLFMNAPSVNIPKMQKFVFKNTILETYVAYHSVRAALQVFEILSFT